MILNKITEVKDGDVASVPPKGGMGSLITITSAIDESIPKSNDDVNKKFSKDIGYIKSFSQCDKVVESLDKYLSKKYDDTFEVDGIKVEYVCIEQSCGMGSYATFYIDFSINETEGITIRYSGHKNSIADYYLHEVVIKK